ncbi:MAG TPA: hypothetical protein VLM05_12825 [Mycobacteriales bacterium]|nr:hypothetical protein [Mycobacteriales bacterium]
MALPAYWLTRPGPEPDAATRAQFDELLARAVAAGPAEPIDYRLAAPKWQFLCHVADRGTALLHGSSAGDIELFEPRQSNDIAEFGNRTAVYAAADGLWALYFAILDRPTHPMSLTNSCHRVLHEDGTTSEPYYFFSVNNEVLEQDQFSPGTVYLLPPEPFEREAAYVEGGRRVLTAQAASLTPVAPMAKLAVEPADFPLRIRGHHYPTQAARIEADPHGFPWLADDEI